MDMEKIIPETDIEKIEADIYSLKKQLRNPYLTIAEMENMMDICQKYFTRLIDWLKDQINRSGDAEDYNDICIDYARDYNILNSIYDNLYYGIQMKREGE